MYIAYNGRSMTTCLVCRVREEVNLISKGQYELSDYGIHGVV